MDDTLLTTSAPPFDIARYRDEISILATHIPLNACSQGPATTRTRHAVDAFVASWQERGMDWEAWIEETERARAAFARLIGADPDCVAITSSVSAAVSALASALDFGGPRHLVVASEAEFPTVGHVWLAQQPRGAHVRWVPVRGGAIELEDYAAAIDEHTRIVSACHGYYLDGFVQDVASIAHLAHQRGAWLFVDAYQTLGSRCVDVGALGVDFLSSGTLKFLMGTAGIAFLYVRPELVERLEPAVTGWFGRANPFAFQAKQLDWSPTSRRFDGGTPPIINAYIARAGMELIEEIGVARIQAWGDVLSRRLIDGAHARGLALHGIGDATRKTATTAFTTPVDSHLIERQLRDRGILASARGPVVRLAPHYYSTLDDVDAGLDALEQIVRSEGQRSP